MSKLTFLKKLTNSVIIARLKVRYPKGSNLALKIQRSTLTLR